MARIRIELPASFTFKTTIPVRITDINYGNHVGNDSILSLLHEARMQFLGSLGYTEMSFEGVGLIMSDVGIEFKSQVYYGETLIAEIQPIEFTKIGFEIIYRLTKEVNGKNVVVVLAKTGLICYSYADKKVVQLPAAALNKLAG
jgi:acyl-CoA thioester hydrolase